ncbi:MAG: cysteine desulfurase [Deltaproteobacteria bacterium]|jgi:cysteine desulfurase|nr:cysteine desulfurase [Deltaproteobacteria bacterium]MBT6492393.1 cysteine desulfurase [Deltaproteobacteria bacterium]
MNATGIYLDWNADAPVSEHAWQAYVEASQHFGNPSSAHGPGRAARAVLENARTAVGHAFGMPADSVIFTSGGTESDALALLGFLEEAKQGSVVVAGIEHPAVIKNLEELCERNGLQLIHAEVGASGIIDVDQVESAMSSDTLLVSVMMASNETGIIQPIQEIAAICRARGVVMHTDAVQAVGRMPVSMPELGVHMMTISGHKFGALSGTGALLVEDGIVLKPQLTGGGQEQGLRGGTENVAGAACMAAALEMLPSQQVLDTCEQKRERFEAAILKSCADVVVLGAEQPRLVNTSCIRFKGCPGDAILMALDIEGIFVSTGSACSSGSVLPSPALLAMGIDEEAARECVRFSFPPELEDVEFETALEKVITVVERMRTFGKL